MFSSPIGTYPVGASVRGIRPLPLVGWPCDAHPHTWAAPATGSERVAGIVSDEIGGVRDDAPVGGEPTDIIRDIEDAFVAQWSHFGRWPGGELRDEHGVLWTETPIKHLPYNAVLRTRLPTDDVDTVLEGIIARYRERDVAFMWLDHPTASPKDLGRRLRELGAEVVVRGPQGERTIALEELQVGPFETVIEPVVPLLAVDGGLAAPDEPARADTGGDKQKKEQDERIHHYSPAERMANLEQPPPTLKGRAEHHPQKIRSSEGEEKPCRSPR